MARVRIEGGCTLIDPVSKTYRYIYDDKLGSHILLFTATQVPKLGDNIDAGVLVPRATVPAEDNFLSPTWPEPIINNDPGFQAKKERYKTWPEDFKG